MSGTENTGRPLRFDIHIHLAGVGTGGSGCWVSDRFRQRPSFLGLRLLYGISRRQLEDSVDQDWAALISLLVEESDLDYGAVLGFDAVYGADGKPDLSRSQMIVPMDWVFTVCERYPNLLPAPSINPYRRDAMDALDEAIDRGACMIKWLPIVQAFDPASARVRPFLARLAETRVPLLVHAGCGEVTFASVDTSVGRLEQLVPALDAGVRVICAHTAAPVHLSRDENQLPFLRDLLNRYTNLWVDNSGLANPARFRHLPRFADDADIRGRTLHGSDFPVISDSFYYPRRFGARTIIGIQSVKNRIRRDSMIKRTVGYDEDSFTRAGGVLASLQRWCGRRG